MYGVGMVAVLGGSTVCGTSQARPAMRATCDARHVPLCAAILAAILAAVPGSWEPSPLVDALKEAL